MKRARPEVLAIGLGIGLMAAPLLVGCVARGYLDCTVDSAWLRRLPGPLSGSLEGTGGAVRSIETLSQAGDPYPLHQKKQLFRNTGAGSFEELTERAGDSFELSEVGRGAALGDVDNDDDDDLLVVNNNGPARALLNQRGASRNWIGLRSSARGVASDGGGARFAVLRPEGPPLWRRAATDGSYASAGDPRLVVGVGDATAEVTVLVQWPSGQRTSWTGLATGRLYSFPAAAETQPADP